MNDVIIFLYGVEQALKLYIDNEVKTDTSMFVMLESVIDDCINRLKEIENKQMLSTSNNKTLQMI